MNHCSWVGVPPLSSGGSLWEGENGLLVGRRGASARGSLEGTDRVACIWFAASPWLGMFRSRAICSAGAEKP